MNTQQQTVLKVVTDLTSSLPTDGKVAVLEHVFLQISSYDLAKLTPAARQALLKVLPLFREPPPPPPKIIEPTRLEWNTSIPGSGSGSSGGSGSASG